MTEAFESEYGPKASQIMENSVKDVGEGAQKRKEANAFAWAQIDASSYNPEFEQGIGADVLI